MTARVRSIKGDAPDVQVSPHVPTRGPCAAPAAADEGVLDQAATLLEQTARLLRDHQNQLAERSNLSVMEPMRGSKRLLTVRDLAQRWQVDEKTIRRWRKEGKLPSAIELGESVLRWDPDVVARWVEERQS